MVPRPGIIKNAPNCAPFFGRFDYPLSLMESVFFQFDSQNPSVNVSERNESNIVRISLSFKDHVSANAARRQLRDLIKRGALGFSVLRIWPIFGSVFRFKHFKTAGFRF